MSDIILETFSEACEEILDLIDDSEDHAVFAICIKYSEDAEGAGTTTNLVANGGFGILEEGIYAEILDQVHNGDNRLFSVLRNAIRDIENELGISPDDEVDPGDSDKRIVH